MSGRSWRYQLDWPEIVTAMHDGWAKARIVKARVAHRCEVDGLDLGAAPVHYRGIRAGDLYIRLHAFADSGPISGAVCADCAGMFTGPARDASDQIAQTLNRQETTT